MFLAKRIIPCLDVKAGRTVKGVNFENLRDAGDIVELAGRYSDEGADELVFLDITASSDHRGTRLEWVERVARQVRIPFTVGGGISSERDVEALLIGWRRHLENSVLLWRWMLVGMVRSGEYTVMGDGWLPIGSFFRG